MLSIVIYRDHLVEALHAASQDYDRAVMTLASGTLALSVTFAHNIAPTPVAWSRNLLVGSWALLGLALIAILISLLTSQGGLRRAIADVDAGNEAALRKPGGLRALITERLNVLAGGSFVVGLGLFAYYAFVNI
jgi:hypothetical protein